MRLCLSCSGRAPCSCVPSGSQAYSILREASTWPSRQGRVPRCVIGSIDCGSDADITVCSARRCADGAGPRRGSHSGNLHGCPFPESVFFLNSGNTHSGVQTGLELRASVHGHQEEDATGDCDTPIMCLVLSPGHALPSCGGSAASLREPWGVSPSSLGPLLFPEGKQDTNEKHSC